MDRYDRTMRLWGVLAILAMGLVVGPASATASSAPANQYRLRHPAREHCRAHYTRRSRAVHHRVHGRRVTTHQTLCVRVKPKAPVVRPGAPAHPVLNAHLASFTQNPTNARAVTYAYSASAIEDEHLASLPTGVLDLYSDGLLKCSTNVGGGLTSGDCNVSYAAFGAHTVVVTFLSGAGPTTVTSSEDIEPFATSSSLILHGPSECESETIPPETESCSYVAEVSTVDQNGNEPREGTEGIAIEKSPEQEFTPALQPSKLLLPGPGFPGPVTFKLERSHAEGGWLCSLRSGNVIEWFGGNPFPYPALCGTTMAAYAYFGDFGGSWSESHSASQPVAF